MTFCWHDVKCEGLHPVVYTSSLSLSMPNPFFGVDLQLAEDGSIMVFEFKETFGEEDAKELCRRFAASSTCETAICTLSA